MQLDSSVLLAVYSICMILRTSVASLERVCTPLTKNRGPDPRGMCGRRIDEMLSVLCTAGYNGRPSYSRNKRDASITKNSLLGKYGFLIPREKANSYLTKRSNFYERGIVCECCYHRCSIFELLDYCMYDPDPFIFSLFKRSVKK